MSAFQAVLASIFAGAATVMLVVSVLRRGIPGGATWSNGVIDAVALVIGVGYAFLFYVDITPAIFNLATRTTGHTLPDWVGQIVTGAIFGAAATFGAKFFNALGAWQEAKKAEAATVSRTTRDDAAV